MKISFRNGFFSRVIILVSIYLIGLLGLPYTINKILHNSDKGLAIKISLVCSIFTLIILLYFSLKNKINNIEINKFSNIKSMLYGSIGLLVMLLVQLIGGLILFILSKIYNFDYVSQNTKFLTEILSQYPIYLFMPIIFAPIAEELVFRKAIFGYFYDILEGSNKVFRFILPSIISGIIFALPHDGFSPIMVIYIAMSFVFNFLYLYTRNILTSITAHMLMNSIVVYIQLLNN